MKLEQQVTSLGLSKRLRDLGVPQNSVFGWTKRASRDEYRLWTSGAVEEWINDNFSAYTVAELGEMLPKFISETKMDFRYLKITHSDSAFNQPGDWYVYYDHVSPSMREADEANPIGREASTEAEARGLMLEYLITNNLIAV